MSRPDPKPRPELTPEHKILHKMEKTFRSFSKPVGCSGTIPLQGDLDKVALWYEQPPSSDASNAVQFKRITIPISDNAAAELYASGTPSAFGFGHGSEGSNVHDESYPVNTFNGKTAAHLGSKLKGIDALWLNAIKEANLEWDIVAVYVSMDRHDFSHARLQSMYRQRDYVNSKGFYELEGAQLGESNGCEPAVLLRRSANYINSDNTAWVTEPKALCGKNSFMTYGNEWNLSSTYVSVAIAVTIPSAEERGAIAAMGEANQTRARAAASPSALPSKAQRGA